MSLTLQNESNIISYKTAPTTTVLSAEFYELLLVSREADKREGILFRQGRGKFQLPSAGHEAVAALAICTAEDDVFYPYYRDRALMLARGTTPYQIALDYFAKKNSSSGGKQLSSHFYNPEHNMYSCATPTGLQCLPAAGTAWAMKRKGSDQITICCIGDAATRQGEFFEAWAFALQENLPLLMVVEDNGYGVSTPTQHLTPLGIGMLDETRLIKCNGRDACEVHQIGEDLIVRMRKGEGPFILWLELDRLMSHTSSDDQRLYRTSEDLLNAEKRDPLILLAGRLYSAIPDFNPEALREKVSDQIRSVYELAEKAENPDVEKVRQHVLSNHFYESLHVAPAQESWTMVDALNYGLRYLLSSHKEVMMFGEDIEDPKGGVFGVTKGLSQQFKGRVINSPLAEATILGTASGLSTQGIMPIFELQFVDFVGPAFNQLVNQIATLRWRTEGKQSCPMVILAPCGSYINCGGPWHSQTSEAWFAHTPGLKVWMPSTPDDALHMLLAAASGEDPVLMLLPKALFRKRIQHYHTKGDVETAVARREGSDVTIVAWGNTVEVALEAAQKLESDDISAEVIDLRSIVPCDYEAIRRSVRKTQQLYVVQEDSETSSFGEHIIRHTISDQSIWSSLKCPPQLIARADVHVGYASNLEAGVLPDSTRVVDTILNNLESVYGKIHPSRTRTG